MTLPFKKEKCVLFKRIYTECKTIIQLSIVFAITSLMAGCGTAIPTRQHNICAIFKQYPKWYWEARDSQIKWGIPVSTQMAIIKQESSFRKDARPPRKWVLGIIPGDRPTTAYGFSQALNGTWQHYQEETGATTAKRDQFGDATDFIGWYARRAKREAHISSSNAYELYLAYHEGIAGYKRKSYLKKPWLIRVARKVQLNKITYAKQLRYCKQDIPQPNIWNLWFK
jgi:hypothetical protein